MPDRVVVYTLRERSEKDRHEKHLAVKKLLAWSSLAGSFLCTDHLHKMQDPL